MKRIVEVAYLKKIGNNEMYLVGFRPAITNQEQINHCKSVRIIMYPRKKHILTLLDFKQWSSQTLDDIGE